MLQYLRAFYSAFDYFGEIEPADACVLLASLQLAADTEHLALGNRSAALLAAPHAATATDGGRQAWGCVAELSLRSPPVWIQTHRGFEDSAQPRISHNCTCELRPPCKRLKSRMTRELCLILHRAFVEARNLARNKNYEQLLTSPTRLR